ncbi:MAG: response regulator [Pyrinomonadaceae bacterium]
MSTVEIKTNILLLVEDNNSDAHLIGEMLDQVSPENFQIVRSKSLRDAVKKLSEGLVDVVLLDLRLPDGSGVDVIKSIRTVASETPIVIVTGVEDEKLALSCIDAGAQDYLLKIDLQPVALRRSIGYAISRSREAQVQDLQRTLDQYRALSSSAADTTITAALSGTGAVRERYSEVFQDLVGNYIDLLILYLDQLVVRKSKPLDQMEALVTKLGDAGGGPRDLLDVHVAALDEAICGREAERAKSLAVEGRLLALEMMGLLVDYYRVGNRRRFI